eukprot:scaffold8896_cov95-Isochrysis_galbana.AAC.5
MCVLCGLAHRGRRGAGERDDTACGREGRRARAGVGRDACARCGGGLVHPAGGLWGWWPWESDGAVCAIIVLGVVEMKVGGVWWLWRAGRALA